MFEISFTIFLFDMWEEKIMRKVVVTYFLKRYTQLYKYLYVDGYGFFICLARVKYINNNTKEMGYPVLYCFQSKIHMLMEWILLVMFLIDFFFLDKHGIG